MTDEIPWWSNNNLLLLAVVQWAISRSFPIAKYTLWEELQTIAVYSGIEKNAQGRSTGADIVRAFIAVEGVAQGLNNALVEGTTSFVGGALKARTATITVWWADINVAIIENKAYELYRVPPA